MSARRLLSVGERVRLDLGGAVCTVIRVTPCAAYIGIPRTKPHPNPERAALGETITSTRVEPISAAAFVYRVGEESWGRLGACRRTWHGVRGQGRARGEGEVPHLHRCEVRAGAELARRLFYAERGQGDEHGVPTDGAARGPRRVPRGYLEAWSGVDGDGDQEALELSVSPKWSAKSLDQAREDCGSFQEDNLELLRGTDDSRAGHDFWLTRNRHGAGYWDGDYPEPAGSTLTAAAHVYGEVMVSFDENTETLELS